jgi:hypothetical protein
MKSVGRSYYFKAYQEFMPPSLSKYRCPQVGYPAGPKWTQSGFKVCVQVVSWPALARHRTGRPRREGGGARGEGRGAARRAPSVAPRHRRAYVVRVAVRAADGGGGAGGTVPAPCGVGVEARAVHVAVPGAGGVTVAAIAGISQHDTVDLRTRTGSGSSQARAPAAAGSPGIDRDDGIGGYTQDDYYVPADDVRKPSTAPSRAAAARATQVRGGVPVVWPLGGIRSSSRFWWVVKRLGGV